MVESPLLKDGVIDRQSYEHAKVKIVHLLKQGVAGQNPEGYTSLIKMIKDGHEKNPHRLERMWIVCARRSYCILHGFPPWKAFQDLSVSDNLWPAFASGAIVNVIKKTGPVTTSPEQLEEESRGYADEVRNQLWDLKPHVVVCGGTFDVWLKRLQVGTEQVPVCPSGMRYMCLDGTFYLDAYHPSHQAKQAMEYSWFRACAGEILSPMVQRGVGQVPNAPDK